MKKNYLILSNIRKLWPKKNNKIIFNNIHAVDNICEIGKKFKQFEITPSHWYRSKNINANYVYLNKIYERNLIFFKNELNKIHKTNYSIKFWRILIGHWLSEFLHIYFDRWQSINFSLKKNIDKSNFIKYKKKYLIPENIEHFLRLYRSPIWGQFLNQEILKELSNKKKFDYIKFSENKIKEELKNKSGSIEEKTKKGILIKIFLFIMKLINFLVSNRGNKFFIYQSYIGTINEIKLSLKLNQLPFFNFNSLKVFNNNINYNLREKNLNKIKTKNKFEKSFLTLALQTLPKSFLEDFIFYKKDILNSNLPKKPRSIFSSNALWYNSQFQFYTAFSVEQNNSKLIYAQHGGTYGISRFSWPEDYEIKTSDKWLSWGWLDKDKSRNVTRFFSIKKKFNKNNKKKINLLFLLKQRKQFFHSLESSSGIESYDEYIKFQSKFLFSLNDKIKKITLLRIGNNYPISNIDIYSNLKNKFKFYSEGSLEEASNKSKLLVHTINSTTMLEGLMSNIPSIILLNKKNNLFRNGSQKFMRDLVSAKILHHDPIAAAKFIGQMWTKDNVNTWWFSKKNQKIIKKFNSQFARSSTNIVQDLKKILTSS